MNPNQQMQALLSAVATMTDEVSALKREVADLTASVNETRDLVQAWEAVKTGGKFIKWLGGIAAAFAAIWLLMRVSLNHMVGAKS